MIEKASLASNCLFSLTLVVVVAGAVAAQGRPDATVGTLTRAERTDYRETSSYADVMAFVEHVASGSPMLHLTSFGYSFEGRSLPLIVAGNVTDASPRTVLATGKTRVYVQGNIHAGEVCGKEALQVLLRSIANGEHAEWFDSLVLLIAPIYNADGNERVRLTNRGRQNGPIGGMGQRPNAQGYDLNRDHMKIDSPEARSLIGLMNEYDPHVVVDLHTTNGTTHAYYLTYSPPLNPSTDPAIDGFLRQDLLPAITRSTREKHGWDFYYYGNLPWRGGSNERGWYTFDHRPRFNNNYVGLRNRVAILGEAYAYASFEDRVKASLWFTEEITNHVYRNASVVKRVVAEADATDLSGAELGLRATVAPSEHPVQILLGEVEEGRNPYSGAPILRRLDVSIPESMPEFGTFRSTETERVPAAYLVPGDLELVLSKLTDHGVQWSYVEESFTAQVERFVIDSSTTAEREFQGHKERTLFGRYEPVEMTVSAGTARVPVAQPLGRLAFYLLEPRSDDGLVEWNVLDDAIEGSDHYPIIRTFQH
jgi:hypothetical protein